MEKLHAYGWDEGWTELYRSIGIDLPAGRITGQFGRFLKCFTRRGEILTEVRGRLSYLSGSAAELPVAGDWVLVMTDEQASGLIHSVLPRKSWVARRRSGSRIDEQLLAANVDYLCIVSAVDGTLNLNLIERYILLAAEGNVKPLLIFNKLDLCGHPAELESRIENRFPGITSRFVSCRTGAGLDTVRDTLLARNSYAFVGPSGVGKSTIINLLFGGQVQKTAPVRAGDHKGRHITSSRQLFLSPSGAILVDTPGLRELALTGEQSSLAEVYTAIADAARNCRYSDCSHTVEQGCAVREGVDNGGIPRDQYENYLKMRRELQHLERKERQAGGYNAKKRWKSISKEIRRLKKWKT